MEKFIKTLSEDERVRFLFVGCLNTAVGIGVTFIVYLLFGYPLFEGAEIPPVVKFAATLSGQIVGAVHSFIWNKFFTFKARGNVGKEFLKFIVVCFVQYAANYLLTLLFSSFIPFAWLYTVLVTAICTVISYFGHKFFSFKGNDEKENDK